MVLDKLVDISTSLVATGGDGDDSGVVVVGSGVGVVGVVGVGDVQYNNGKTVLPVMLLILCPDPTLSC